MRGVSGIVARTAEPVRLDALLAVALTVAGELEVLLVAADGGSRLVSALAVPVATLPLAWRRRVPLLPPVAVAITLLVQAPLDGLLIGHLATPLVALLIGLYSAGRHAAGAKGLAAAVVVATALATIRIAFDFAVKNAGEAVLTLVAVLLPVLVGRWVRGQSLLQRKLEERAARLTRERDRDARQAADEERVRIATDLQAAVAGGLGVIVQRAQQLEGLLAVGDHARAREQLASIAGTAREALADVRRILGILRRDGRAPRTPSTEPATATVADVPAAAWRRPRRSLPVPGGAWADRLLVAALLVLAEVDLATRAASGDRLLAALTAVPVVAPLLLRRRAPVPAALATFAAIALQSTLLRLDTFPVSDIAALMCAVYAVGAYAERRAAVAGLALLALADAVHAAVFYPDGVAIALLGGVAVPWTVGRSVRGQRGLTRAVREDAAQLERRRDREARAAVTAERMRVARELHDAVAHNISVIAIQAAGADGIVDRDPARAAQCVALIEAVAREAIVELGRLAGAAGAAGPQPGLARVEALAERAREGGLPVELRVEGEPAPLPAGVDLAAFRIVQEALANASKHAGDARAWVVVRYRARALELEIGDDGRGPNGRRGRNGSGHGLAGMRERVALYGGTLDVGGDPGGGFAVRARLPLGAP